VVTCDERWLLLILALDPHQAGPTTNPVTDPSEHCREIHWALSD
jgi:hypothetical protein